MDYNDLHDKKVDLGVTPEGPYADQRPYPPKKKPGGLGPVWIGIVAVALIIVATYFVFSGGQSAENTAEDVAVPPPVTAPTEPTPPEVADSTSETGSFTPSPEMVASEETAASGTIAGAPEASGEKVTGTADGGKTDKQPSAASVKPAEKKPSEAKAKETKPQAKGTDTKAPSSEGSKNAVAKEADKKAEGKPDKSPEPKATAGASDKAEPSKVVENKTETTKAEAGEKTADKGGETKAVETKTTETKADEAKSEAGENGSDKTQDAKAAESQPISDKWVVNISSTPDAALSLKVLSQAMSRKDTGEFVYAYETAINGVAHHRIRIGFFNSRAEAEAAGLRFKEALKLSAAPWAVQPTVQEVERFKK